MCLNRKIILLVIHRTLPHSISQTWWQVIDHRLLFRGIFDQPKVQTKSNIYPRHNVRMY